MRLLAFRKRLDIICIERSFFMKMFIDCDPGVDDSIALLFALYRPDVDLVGISTSVGNVSAAQGAENTLRILKLAGKEGMVPVPV